MINDLKEFIKINTSQNWKPKLKDYPEKLWESNWPWAPLFKNIDNLEMVRVELNSIDYLFSNHRTLDKQGSYGHKGWSAITLHGIDVNKTENYPIYGFKSQAEANYRWTDVCEKIPEIMKIVKSLPFRNYGRVRIMRLAPGGYVMPHDDGKGRIFGPFNFALTNPDGCNFVFEKYGVVPFKAGRGFMLDLGITHCVFNDSDEVRYHLIIHGDPTETIEEHFKTSIFELE